MKSLNDIVEAMTDEQLEQSYFDIKERRTTGVLKDNVVQGIHGKLEEITKEEQSLDVTEARILFEIAERKYEPKFAAFGDHIEIVGNVNNHPHENGTILRVVPWEDFNPKEEARYGVEAENLDGGPHWFVRHCDYKIVR